MYIFYPALNSFPDSSINSESKLKSLNGTLKSLGNRRQSVWCSITMRKKDNDVCYFKYFYIYKLCSRHDHIICLLTCKSLMVHKQYHQQIFN